MSIDPDEQPVLEIRDLVTWFCTDEGMVKAVDGSSPGLYEGGTLGIVGESGSGKSVTAPSMFQLVDSPGRVERGNVRYRGDDLLEKSEAEIRSVWGNGIAAMFQNPITNPNPVFTVGNQVSWVVKTHQDVPDATARERTIELMADMDIPKPTSRVDNYPHQSPGEMCQRALFTMTISCEPDMLTADEPVTALSVTIETQILNVLDESQEKYGVSITLITYNPGAVAGACDRVVITYDGCVVKHAGVDDPFENPRHPYTRDPIRSIPRLTDGIGRLTPVEGDMPDLIDLSSGCSFHPWCPHAITGRESYGPELREVESSREAACFHAHSYDLSPSAVEAERAEADGGGPTALATDGDASQ